MITLFKSIHLKVLKSPSIWIAVFFAGLFLSFYPSSVVGVFASPNLIDFDVLVTKSLRDADILIKSQVSMSIIITGLIIVVCGVFLESFVKIDSSLFKKNVYLSPVPKYQYYLVTIAPIFTYSLIYLGFSFSLLLVYDSIGLIAGQSVSNIEFYVGETLNVGEANIIKWEDIQWGYLIYSFILSISLIIIISMLIVRFVKSPFGYISLIWGYVFLIFFFGGSSVPLPLVRDYSEIIVTEEPLSAFVYISYLIPNTYTNFLFVDAFVGIVDFSKSSSIINIFAPFGIFILFLVGLIISKILIDE